jgi:hypothetical protein
VSKGNGVIVEASLKAFYLSNEFRDFVVAGVVSEVFAQPMPKMFNGHKILIGLMTYP